MAQRRLHTSVLSIATVVALSFVSVASADETVSQAVPEGGTVSSGTTVSSDDPVQVTATAGSEGTITIVKRTGLSRPTPKGGAEEDTSTPQYLGPRFEIRGDATVAKVDVLVDKDSLPESGFYNPQGGRFAALLVNCTVPSRGAYSCGFGSFGGEVRGGEQPDGTLRGEVSGVTGSDGLNLDFAKAGFQAGTGGIRRGDRDTLGVLLRTGEFKGYFGCSLRCTVTPKVFVSRRVQRALGLDSRIIAEDTLKGTRQHGGSGVQQPLDYTLKLEKGVAAVLRRKRVAAIAFGFTIRYNGPDGATEFAEDNQGHRIRNDFYSTSASRFGLTCRVRGLSSIELALVPRKGHRCPDAGRDFEGPPEWE